MRGEGLSLYPRFISWHFNDIRLAYLPLDGKRSRESEYRIAILGYIPHPFLLEKKKKKKRDM